MQVREEQGGHGENDANPKLSLGDMFEAERDEWNDHAELCNAT